MTRRGGETEGKIEEREGRWVGRKGGVEGGEKGRE